MRPRPEPHPVNPARPRPLPGPAQPPRPTTPPPSPSRPGRFVSTLILTTACLSAGVLGFAMAWCAGGGWTA